MSKQFKVFLSSSFQDMHEERDYLKYHAFAALQEEMFQKGWDLQILDLRGTTTQPDLLQEEAVLRLCLDGVNDCIPRMVVLLGDRYGWIPYGEGAEYIDEQARNRAELSVQNINDAPNLDISKPEMAGRSVTHLEIYYGLKQMPHDDIFVYQREALPYDRMTDAQRMVYCSGYNAQQQLKAEIGEKMSGHSRNIRHYSARWDSESGCVTGLEALDTMLYADLKASFEKELAAAKPEKTASAQDSADILTSLARATIRRNAAGAPDPPPEFLDILEKTIEHRGFYLVTGESGSGVTTYMAQLCYSLMFYAQWREKHGQRPMLVVKYTPESHLSDLTAYIMLMQLLGQLETAAVDICPEEEQEKLDSAIDASIALNQDYSDKRSDYSKRDAVIESMSEMLRHFLSLLHNAYDIFIVLCDVDMLIDEHNNNETLYWLSGIPSDVAVIFSAAEGSMTPCMEYELIRVPPLSADLINEIMTTTAREYGKRFSDEILELAGEKLLSSGYATALHVRVLSECLMNMTGPDYLTFTGLDAHLTFMRHLIGEIPGYVDGVFDLLVNRAKAAYGDLAIAALRLLRVSRAAIPEWIFREALSLNLGREVSQLELFSLKGYLHSSLKHTRGFTWQLAHESFKSALMMHIGDAVKDSAAAMLQTLRRHMSCNPFIISEFVWYGYWAEDPTAVSEYIDVFYDNNAAHHAMIYLFVDKLHRADRDWMSYLKSAIEPLREDPDDLVGVFYMLCVSAPDTEDAFNANDALLKTYLSAAADVVSKKNNAELGQRYISWLLTANIVREDRVKRREVLLALEAASLNAALQFNPREKGDSADWCSYMADVLYAQTILCDNSLLEDPEFAKACFGRALTTFDQLGEDGVRHLIETEKTSFLDILGTYFLLHHIINGVNTPKLAEKLDLYIGLLESREPNQEVLTALFRLYDAVIQIHDAGQDPGGMAGNGEYLPTEKEDRIYAYHKKIVDLGHELYPQKLKNGKFVSIYLKAMNGLAMEQVMRGNKPDAAETNRRYYVTILNLHANEQLSEEEVADSSVYKATEEFVAYSLSEDSENWRNLTDYLWQMGDWVDSCRSDPLHLSIRHANILLLQARYSAMAEDCDTQETDQFCRDALLLILNLPDQLAERISDGLGERERRNFLQDILMLLPNMFEELIIRDMITNAEQITTVFKCLCLNWLDHPPVIKEGENMTAQISEEFHLTITAQEQQSRHLSAQLAGTLAETMEEYLGPQHAGLKNELSAIRKAIKSHQK